MYIVISISLYLPTVLLLYFFSVLPNFGLVATKSIAYSENIISARMEGEPKAYHIP